MTLKEQLNADLRAAMRARDEDRKRTLRMLLSAVRYAEIERHELLDDEGVSAVVAKEAKQRRDSIGEFEKGGRQDLVEIERAELQILIDYLPRQLTEDEIDSRAGQVIEELGATGPKDMGAVMRGLMPLIQGRADGKLVSEIVKRRLQQRG